MCILHFSSTKAWLFMETTEIQVEKYSGYDNHLLQIRSEREAAALYIEKESSLVYGLFRAAKK